MNFIYEVIVSHMGMFNDRPRVWSTRSSLTFKGSAGRVMTRRSTLLTRGRWG